jgi:hypothetical protein
MSADTKLGITCSGQRENAAAVTPDQKGIDPSKSACAARWSTVTDPAASTVIGPWARV